MKINACYVNQEPDYGDAAQPDSLEWELCVAGDRMIGEIYLPSGIYDAPHPAVIICHGIPGINCNDDLAQALRRMGCVVIRLCHRGSWGSGGTYSFTHCIEDAVHQKVILETNHSLDTARFALADTMGRWVQKCVETPFLSR